MVKSKAFRLVAIASVIAGPLTVAMATDGYFSHGYGMQAKGMGGAAVAMTDNAFAGANNPATAAWAGNRLELGLDLFAPSRDAARVGGGAPGAVTSDSNLFYVPEVGYNKAINDKLGVGVTVYGNGGMNTNYANGNIMGPGVNMLGGSGRLGVDLTQLIIAPTAAYKFSDNQSVGISPLIVQQQFKADGLSGFGVSNNGYDTSSGLGVRLGYLAKLNGTLSIGASYAPKIAMSKFSKYAGLFAEGGGFDIPENYTLGASFKATSDVMVALDYQKIGYSGVRSIANPSNAILSGIPLGASNGSGFGWSDINVWKLGAQWQATPSLILRAGLNVSDNPIKSSDVTFNILAPGVVTTHYTLGGTYAMSKELDVTLAYMYAPSNSVSGPTLAALPVGGTETIKMSQQSLGIQFGWHW